MYALFCSVMRLSDDLANACLLFLTKEQVCFVCTIFPRHVLNCDAFIQGYEEARLTMAVFILEEALSVWMTLGKQLLFVWWFVSSIKTGTRCIVHLDELCSVVCLKRCTTEDSSSRRCILCPSLY